VDAVLERRLHLENARADQDVPLVSADDMEGIVSPEDAADAQKMEEERKEKHEAKQYRLKQLGIIILYIQKLLYVTFVTY